MLSSVLTLTQVLNPQWNKQQEGCKALLKYLQCSPEALGCQGKRNKAKIKDRLFFKYIKMDTIGLYIHIHLTKPGRKGRGGLFKVSDI